MKLGTVRMYAPEEWGTLEKFSKFYGTTHTFSKTGKRALSGTTNHFRKADTLRNLAHKIVPELALEAKELDENGFSEGISSAELSAVIEAIVLELYASLDCTRKVITEIYAKYQGVPDSTRKYFQNIQKGKIDPEFPEQLVLAVTEASWYTGFRIIRDELTHLDSGSCSKDRETGKVRYMHSGIKINGKPLIIEDIFEKIDQSFNEVNQFIGRVFAYLYSSLKDEATTQLCGIFGGRAYTRTVTPSQAIDFHGGVCSSYKWFELEGNPTCIFAEQCGAYKNANKSV